MYAHRWCLLTLLLIANVKVTACQNEMALWFFSETLLSSSFTLLSIFRLTVIGIF